MRPRRRRPADCIVFPVLAWVVALAALGVPLSGHARPTGYPRSYDKIIESANKESEIVIYTTTHIRTASDIFSEFHKLYPRVRVVYVDGTAASINNRLMQEVSGHHRTADLVWSTAADLQTKLINDGYAQVYASPEKPNLPTSAVWKDQGYGVTSEPIVIAYNRRLVPPGDVPRSHIDLEHLLKTKSRFYQGKVATYDPITSEIGLMVLSHDVQATHETWDLVRQLGAAHVRFFTTSNDMLDAISRGEVLVGYNLVGSSALERQKQDPAIGVVLPADYLLTIQPLVLIPAEAAHPNAARLFLDFLLSRGGQAVLARHRMTPARLDMDASLGWNPGDTRRVRAIRVGPSLLADLDQQNRARLIREWRRNLSAH